jgi:hypothetical protein
VRITVSAVEKYSLYTLLLRSLLDHDVHKVVDSGGDG